MLRDVADGRQTLGMSNLGNTAGTSGVVQGSGVQYLFAGGANITLSQSLQGALATLTISGGAGGGGGPAGSNTLGMSNLGNTSGTSGVISGSALRYLFAGGNNLTLSQSIDGDSATLTLSAGSSAGHTHLKAELPAAIAYEDEANDFLVNQRIRDFLELNSYLEVSEILEPGAGAANTARIYAVDEDGFTRLDVVDSTGLRLRLTRDNSLVVKNTEGTTISKGEVVYVDAGTPGEIRVKKARGDADATMPAIGIALEAINNDAFGRVLLFGLITGLNTAAFAEGARLFVSDSTAGALTATAPPHPSLRQRVAVVLVSHASQGVLFFAPVAQRGDHEGTNQNLWKLGNNAAGAKSIQFRNGFDGDLAWNPSAARTVHLPNAGGTLALGTHATTVFGVSQDNISGSRTSRFALEDHRHAGIERAGVSNLGNTAGDTGTGFGQLVFQGSNGIPRSQVTDTGSRTIIVSGLTATINSGQQTLGMSNLGQTSGTSGVISGSAVRYLFAGSGQITLRQSIDGSTATLTISASERQQSIGISNLGNTGGTSGFVQSNVWRYVFAGGNAITVSQSTDGNSGTLSIVANTPGLQTIGMSNLGNTAGTSGVVTGTAVRYLFAGGPNITVSQSINASTATLTISAAAPGGGGVPNRSFFAMNESCDLQTIANLSGASFSKRPIFAPMWYDGGDLIVNSLELFLSRRSGTSLNITHGMGLYTFVNDTQVSLLASATQAISLTTSAQYSGMRRYRFTNFETVTLTRGKYLVGYFISGSNNSTAVADLVLAGALDMNNVGFVFEGTNSTAGTVSQSLIYPWLGVYASTTAAFPGSVHRTQIAGGNSDQRANYYAIFKQAS